MTMAAVSQCYQCAAVVNINWPSCLVCRAILQASPEVPVPSSPFQATPMQGGDPIAPILPGWLVAYRDQAGRLCGGVEDRIHGTVRECQWNGSSWTLYLTDGQWLPLAFVRSVGKTNTAGRVVAAWTVREHGFTGTAQGENESQ